MPITQENIDNLSEILSGGYAAGNRAEFYLAYYQLLKDNGADVDALKQILIQTQISTYSGFFGGAALLGNAIALAANPEPYPGPLDNFSYEICVGMLAAIQADFSSANGDGILTAQQMQAADQGVWEANQLKDYFPGNIQLWWVDEEGLENFFSAGSLSAALAGYQLIFGAQVGFRPDDYNITEIEYHEDYVAYKDSSGQIRYVEDKLGILDEFVPEFVREEPGYATAAGWIVAGSLSPFLAAAAAQLPTLVGLINEAAGSIAGSVFEDLVESMFTDSTLDFGLRQQLQEFTGANGAKFEPESSLPNGAVWEDFPLFLISDSQFTDDKEAHMISAYQAAVINAGDGGDLLFAYDSANANGEGGEDFIFAKSDAKAFGGADDDIIVGLESSELRGGAADDWIFAAGGAVAYGNVGEDIIVGFESAKIFGGQDDDVIFSFDTDEGFEIDGGIGADIIVTLLGTKPKINGGAGEDFVYALSDHAYIQGGGGADEITADDGNDSIFAGYEPQSNGVYDDNVSENDSIYAEGGNDYLVGDRGADYLNGGTGSDTVDYRKNQSSVEVTLSDDDEEEVSPISSGDATGDLLVSIESLILTEHDDKATGNKEKNALVGLLGKDTLIGGLGNDSLFGYVDPDSPLDGYPVTEDNAGNRIEGEAGNDSLYGGIMGDTLLGGADNDRIMGWRDGGGNDTLVADHDSITGGAGHDSINADAGNDTVDGGADNDSIRGMAGADSILGGGGADYISGGAGNDKIDAGTGDDWVVGGAGADDLEGGAGNDTLSYYESPVGVTVTLADSDTADDTTSGGDAEGDTAKSFEALILSDHDDVATGDSKDNVFHGLGGADHLKGEDGEDVLIANQLPEFAGSGLSPFELPPLVEDNHVNTLDGGAKRDVLFGDGGADQLLGGDGNDFLDGGDGGDVLDGGAGVNVAMYTRNSSGVSANLADNSNNDGDTYTNIQHLAGSAHGDTLNGDDGDNVLVGLAGGDEIDGGGGADTIIAYDPRDPIVNVSVGPFDWAVTQFWWPELGSDSGNNTLRGGGDNDQIYGGVGRDVLEGEDGSDGLHGGDDADTLRGGTGDDVLYGDKGGDELHGDAGLDNLFGGEGMDTLKGGADADILQGDDGGDLIDGEGDNDVLYGGSGDDTLAGGSGADELFGDDGTDVFYGGSEGGEDDTVADEFTGGAGGDRFNMGQDDRVLDPDHQGDHVYAGDVLLKGGKKKEGDDYYENEADGSRYYKEQNGVLRVEIDGVTFYLDNFQNGAAGINLEEDEDDPNDGDGDTDPTDYASPLVLDLDGDGVELIDLAQSPVFFDIDKDGFAERIGWVAPDDGLLAYDANGDGIINDASELFGDGFVPPSTSVSQSTITNGFDALALFDSNQDNVIDANDAQFADLLLWQDVNSNGLSEAGELTSASAAGITAINFDFMDANQLVAGNYIYQTGSYDSANLGPGAEIADAWFAYDPRASIDRSPAIDTSSVEDLPDLRGWSDVRNLWQAMALDPVLEQMVRDFDAMTLTDASELAAKTEAIILRWFGADDIDPRSRGPNTNGAWLAVVEKLQGYDFKQFGLEKNPRPYAGAYIMEQFKEFHAATMTRLLAQTSLGQSLVPGISYDLLAFLTIDSGTTLSGLLSTLTANAPSNGGEKISYWHSMSLLLHILTDDMAESASQISTDFSAAAAGDGVHLTYEQLRSALLGGDGDQFIVGPNAAPYYGGVQSEISFSKDNVIYGGGGNDYLDGDQGSDIYLFGYGDGHDTIRDWSNNNTVVQFLAGVDPSDITLSYTGYHGSDLTMSLAGSADSLTYLGFGFDLQTHPDISEFRFIDSASNAVVSHTPLELWDLATLGEGTNFLHYASDNGDLLSGGPGYDELYGGLGNDTYAYADGDGQDVIFETGGNGDMIAFASGVLSTSVALGHRSTYYTGYDNSDLYITLPTAGDEIRIVGQYNSTTPVIETFSFDGGNEILTAQQVTDLMLAGTSGNDKITGTPGADEMVNSPGNDDFRGLGGDDRYYFGSGDGRDDIFDSGHNNILRITGGLDIGDFEVTRTGGENQVDLVLTLTATGERITIHDQYTNTNPRVATFEFDNDTLTADDMLTEMGIDLLPTAGDDLIYGNGSNNSLTGGLGNDTLRGLGGNDTYNFAAGDGDDRILDGAGINSVDFNAINQATDATLSVTADGLGLIVDVTAGAGGSVTVADYFEHTNNYTLDFADGSMTIADVIATLGLANAPFVQGGDDFNVFDGWDGSTVEFFAPGGGVDMVTMDDGDHLEFNLGDYLTYVDTAVTSTAPVILMGEGISPDDIHIRGGISWEGPRYGGRNTTNISHLEFLIVATDDRLIIQNEAQGTFDYHDLFEVRFEEGTIWTPYDIFAALKSTVEAENIYLSAEIYDVDDLLDYDYADTISGSSNDDSLLGGGGNDVYVFGAGSGRDLVYENWADYAGGDENVLRFGADILPNDIAFLLVDDSGINYHRDVYVEYENDYWLENRTNLPAEFFDQQAKFQLSGTNEWIHLAHRELVTYIEFDTTGPLLREDVIQMIAEAAGTTGDDKIFGSWNDDDLDGLSGNDYLAGDQGNDEYIFDLGFGHDVIDDRAGTVNRIRFGVGISSTDIFVDFEGHTLILTHMPSGDSVRVLDHFQADDTVGIAQVQFVDEPAVIWDRAKLQQDVAAMVDGDDLIFGGTADDTLSGGAGDDHLEGGVGNDRYLFNAGDGSDTIVDSVGTADKIVFGSNVLVSNIYAERGADGNSVKLGLVGSADAITFGPGIESVEFSDASTTVWSYEQAAQMALDQTATTGADSLSGIIGSITLDGGVGDDTLRAASGNTVLLDIGSGQDVLVDYPVNISIEFGSSLTPEDIHVSRVSNADGTVDLVLGVRGTTDQLTIVDQFAEDRQISSFAFSGGPIWNQDALLSAVLAEEATNHADTLIGGYGNDTINGGGGNDFLVGGIGDDLYEFGVGGGHDTIGGIGVFADSPHFDWDTLKFVGLQETDVSWSQTNPLELVATINSTGESITMPIMSYYGGSVTTMPQAYVFSYLDTSGNPVEISKGSWDILKTLYGYDKNGTEGDDLLNWDDWAHGYDTIDPLGGNDYIFSYYDDATIIFGTGYGVDTYDDQKIYSNIPGYPYVGWEDDRAEDTVQLTGDLTLSDLTFYRSGPELEDLIIEIDDTGDQFIVKGQFSDFSHFDLSIILTEEEGRYQLPEGFDDPNELTSEDVTWKDIPVGVMHWDLNHNPWDEGSRFRDGIDFVEFTDGSGLTLNRVDIANLASEVLIEGDNVLSTDFSGGTLDGGDGNDVLQGGSGNDVFVFDRGYEEDVIVDSGGNDMISFGAGVLVNEVQFSRVGEDGDDLFIEVGGVERLTMLVEDQFASATDIPVESFEFTDGTVYSWQEVQEIILAQQVTWGDDSITGFRTDDFIEGDKGDDWLVGHYGHDTILAGDGADTAVFYGPVEDYLVTVNGNITTVTDLQAVGGDGTDELHDVEHLEFLAIRPGTANDTVTGDEDNVLTIDALANDVALDGGAYTLTGATVSTGLGDVSIVDNQLVYDPGSHYNHMSDGESVAVQIDYTVDDGLGGSDGATVFLTVDGINDAPTLGADTAATDEDSAVTVADVLANDSDPEGDGFSLTGVSTQPGQGSASFSGNSVTYDPGSDMQWLADQETADVTVSYTAEDVHGAANTGALVVTVSGLNDAPDAVDDLNAGGFANGDIVIDVLGNDVDPDLSDDLSITAATLTAGLGSLAIGNDVLIYSPDGAYDYLDDNENVTVSIDYSIVDPHGLGDSASVALTVFGLNDGGIAGDDTATVDEDGTVSFDPLLNDTDPEGDTLSLVDVSVVSGGGTASVSAGQIVYDPGTDYQYLADGESSDAILSYTLQDDRGAIGTGSATVTVTGSNDAPVAMSNNAGTDEDSSILIDVLANDSDPDTSDVLSIVSASVANGLGSVTIENGKLRYDPGSDYQSLAVGQTAQVTLDYGIEDNHGLGASSTVVVTITGTNDGPVAAADSGATDEGTAVTVDVLANDTDIDTGDLLTVTAASVSSGNGAASVQNGQVVYDPAGGYEYLGVGESAVVDIAYTIEDDHGGSDGSTLQITVNGLNDGPTAAADNVAADEDNTVLIDVLANDSDIDGDVLTIQSASLDSGLGSVVVENGKLRYDPGSHYQSLAVGESAVVGLSYMIDDGNGGSDTATVTVTIAGVNDGPSAVDDTGGSTDEESAITLAVLGNDTDIDASDLLSLTGATINSGNGSLSIVNDEIVYDPNGQYESLGVGESADVIVGYDIGDGNGGTDSALATVTVTGVNDGPQAVADSAATDENNAIQIMVLANDSDVDGDDLTVTSASVSNGLGGVSIVDGTKLNYDPGSDYDYLADGATVTVDLAYAIADGQGGTANGTVAVTVTGTNDDPSLVADLATTDEDSSTNIDVLANDSDVDGGTLSLDDVSIVSGGGSATVVNGEVTYDPQQAYQNLGVGDSAEVELSYTAGDGQGGSDSAAVTVTVTGLNDDPTANGDTVSTDEETALLIDVLSNDSDIDGDTIAVTAATLANGLGSVSLQSGQVHYDPGSAYQDLAVGDSATVTLDYTIADTHGAQQSSSVVVTVDGVNDGPDALADNGSTDEDSSVSIDVLSNDSDIDGDTLTVTAASVTSGGGAVSIQNNQLSFDPGTDFQYLAIGATANSVLTYTIDDGNGGSDSADVTVTVTGSNDGPVVTADTASTNEDTATTVAVLANDSDPDGDALSLIAASLANGAGAVSIQNDQIVYDPTGAYDNLAVGQSATVELDYTVADSHGLNSPGTAQITVTGVNDAPLAADNTAATDEDVPITIDVLSNDSDIDGDSLSVQSASDGSNGSVAIETDGTLTYTPDSGFSGLDNFTYVVADGNGGTDTATVTVDVIKSEILGTTGDDTLSGGDAGETFYGYAGDDLIYGNGGDDWIDGGPDEDSIYGGAGSDTVNYSNSPAFVEIDLTSTGSQRGDRDGDARGDNLYSIENIVGSNFNDKLWGDDADNIIVGLDGNDNIRGFGGDDVFVYGRTNSGQNTDELTDDFNSGDFDILRFEDWIDYDQVWLQKSGARLNVYVLGSAEYFQIDEWYRYSVPSDPADWPDYYDTKRHIDLFQTADGHIMSAWDVDALVDAMAATGYTGYTSDTDLPTSVASALASDFAAAWFPNAAPTAVDDTATTDEDSDIFIDVLANDTDPDGDSLTIKNVENLSNQGTALAAGGQLRFDPGDDFAYLANGESEVIQLTYTAFDGAEKAIGIVDLTVTGVNDGPTGVTDLVSTPDDTALVISVLTNDVDPEGDAISLDSASGASNGSLVLNGDGTVTYTPNTGFDGLDSFSYTMSDTYGATGTGTVHVAVDNNVKTGTNGNNSLSGNGQSSLIFGLGGNDFLDGNGGDDLISGGTGSDTIYGDYGNDIAYGGDGDDIVYGNQNDDVLYGDGGNDTMYGGQHNDDLHGGDGDDKLYGNLADDSLHGGAGNDSLHGQSGNDTYRFGFGDGHDVIINNLDNSDSSTTIDKLIFEAGVTREHIWFSQVADDLYMHLLGSDDWIMLDEWDDGGSKELDQYETATGDVLDKSDVAALVSAMAAFDPDDVTFDASGNPILPTAVDAAIVANWTT